MCRRLLTLALGAMLVLAMALPAAAAQTKIPISGEDGNMVVLEQGRTWVSDGIQHVRGWTGEYDTTGGAYVDGTSIIVANWNLNLATGDGTMWGTTDLALTAFDGGWHQTWVAKFDDFVWSGRAVGRGSGELQGMKIHLDVWSTGAGTDAFEGFVR